MTDAGSVGIMGDPTVRFVKDFIDRESQNKLGNIRG